MTTTKERIKDFVYSQFQQYVETLDRWECKAERLSMGRLDKLKNVLGKN